MASAPLVIVNTIVGWIDMKWNEAADKAQLDDAIKYEENKIRIGGFWNDHYHGWHEGALWARENSYSYPSHNHITRDIKPFGQCHSCDIYHYKELQRQITNLEAQKEQLIDAGLQAAADLTVCQVESKEKSVHLDKLRNVERENESLRNVLREFRDVLKQCEPKLFEGQAFLPKLVIMGINKALGEKDGTVR